MKSILLIPILLFLFNFNSHHQLNGTVIDSETNENLAGVSININDKTIYTDLNGNFSIIVKSGDYKLETNYISYNEYEKELKIKKDTNLTINILPESNR